MLSDFWADLPTWKVCRHRREPRRWAGAVVAAVAVCAVSQVRFGTILGVVGTTLRVYRAAGPALGVARAEE